MKDHYFIGIDGGGTKTKFQCYSTNGELISETISSGTFYRQDGIDTVIDVLKSGIEYVRKGISPDSILGIGFGMPGYGEDAVNDPIAVRKISSAFSPYPIVFENDVVVGWAAAFAFSPGVNIVAGTGSIGYGRDGSGNIARSGGWSVFFSDEGSGYWLGKKALELFSKQSDGRLVRGPLYDLMHMYFNLSSDFELIPIIEEHYANDRSKVASLQIILCNAANAGDKAAIEAYNVAAEELASIVCAIANQLNFSDKPIPVSYIGGLFNLNELLLRPMQKAISRHIYAEFHTPLLPPCAGATLFIAKQVLDNSSFLKYREQLIKFT